MSSIQGFVDFMAATRPKLFSSVSEIRNEATKYRTYLIRTMLNGLSEKKFFQAGSSIVDYIQLSLTSNYMEYLPTDDFEFTGSNSLSKIEIPWRHSLSYSTANDHELILNGGEDEKTCFKRLRDVKQQEMMTGQFEGWEDSLWAAPDYDEMELVTGNGRKPYSLRCFVTDNGLAPTAANAGATGSTPTWTTVMGQSAATNANWRNQVETYDSTNINTALIPAFDLMWLDVQFESPENAQQYAQDTRLNKMKILCSKKAYAKCVDLAAQRNDTLSPRSSFGADNGKIAYAGVPLQYVGALDTVDASYDTAGTFKYRWFNFNYNYPVHHSKRFMYAVDPQPSASQPFARVMIRDTWRNLWCASRRQQGIVLAA